MKNKQLWLVRVLIGIVLFFNLQCALAFLWHPGDYVAGFGLDGEAGAGMTRALGLLFVMWNVPYVFACVHPVKYRVSLIEAVIMQAIGLAGEMFIFLSGNYQDLPINATVGRFILFDGFGLIFLFLSLIIDKNSLK